MTGFLADDVESMRESITRLETIMPLACREHVVRNSSAARMAGEYLQLYREMVGDERAVPMECDKVMT